MDDNRIRPIDRNHWPAQVELRHRDRVSDPKAVATAIAVALDKAPEIRRHIPDNLLKFFVDVAGGPVRRAQEDGKGQLVDRTV